MVERAPLPRIAQPLEARGFERQYGNDPYQQARFVEALCGWREVCIASRRDTETVDALIKDFSNQYPEFLETDLKTDNDSVLGGDIYTIEPQLKQYLKEEFGIGASSE